MDKAKCNGILRLFIGFVQDKNTGLVECSVEECATFLNWLSSDNMDVIPHDEKKRSSCDIPSFWASSLSKMLPILLECNGNIKHVDENGKTILHVFLEKYVKSYLLLRKDSTNKILQMVQYLIGKGISVEAADRNGNTPLHFAAKLSSTDLMEKMLEKCMNLNIRNEQGDGILHVLADNCVDYEGIPIDKLAELAQLMLSKGADVNLQNNKGWTPVHFAAKHNHLCMIKFFIKSNANLKLLTNAGENALLLSCKHIGSTNNADIPIELTELLINGGCDVNVTDADGYSSLHYVSLHCQTRTGDMLIKAGADIYCRTKDYLLTPLHCAASYGHLEMTKLLVDAGAILDAEATDSVTPLHCAALRNFNVVAEYLIGKGANVRCRETLFGFSLLHMAALGWHIDNKRLQLLLDQGLNVNDGGEYGISALHLASFVGNVEMVEMLIENGADVHRRDNVTHLTPLHLASTGWKIVKFMKLYVSGIEDNPLWKIISHTKEDTEQVIALLVRNGADANTEDTLDETTFDLLKVYEEYRMISNTILGRLLKRMNENIDPTRRFLKCDAFMDVQDKQTLSNAFQIGFESTIKNLLEFNDDVNEADTCWVVLSCQVIKYSVLRHVTTLRAAELPVLSNYIPHINEQIWPIYYTCCLGEVKKMKTHLIDNAISLYDLLHMNWKRRLNFVEKVSGDLESEYRLYNGIIQSSCREASQRKLLIEPAKDALYQLTKFHLPDICTERILDYLKTRYLKALVDSVSVEDV